ncbi:MAG: carboxylating nicotinate-nucleotide diphosphorylase [Bacteroidales bacterium]|nr:carboxylating nicotinate-nucleotide diphosphorylase [Bacteroidales bacterium]
MENRILEEFIIRSLEEDLGDGDHTSLACISPDARGKARLIIKEKGLLAGIRVIREAYPLIDRDLQLEIMTGDGTSVNPGDIVFYVSGSQQSILKSERLILNILQRMSGIATSTREYAEKLKGLRTKILDTRKTTPGMRFLEKEAVRIGGGVNHRMGLHDMIMIKDNHIDYSGGIENAVRKTRDYLSKNNLNLSVEIEARSLTDVRTILATGGVDRVMLDNFTIDDTRQAVEMISGELETESSGGINLSNIRAYAECGVDFVSVGALTHHIRSLDMSLKSV